MESTDELADTHIRTAVREAQFEAGRSLLSTILWTLIAIFSVFVGLQLVQLGGFTDGLASAGVILGGVVVTGCSLYLLYLLHWK
jgi:hypothetical protein